MLLSVVHIDRTSDSLVSSSLLPATSKSITAPYPFFSNIDSPSLFNSVLKLFGFKTTNNSPLGFMPRQIPCTTLVPVDVACSPSIPISSSHLHSRLVQIPCSPDDLDTNTDQGSEHCQSSLRTRSPTDSFYSLSSLSLSEILQHHYQSNNSTPDPHSEPISSSPSLIPLAVASGQSNIISLKTTVTASPKSRQQTRASSKHILDNSGNNSIHIRDTRTNSRHLCTLVIEINMMRAQKIVGPLRPRHCLPKRKDAFVANRPSRLREE
ncbi:hypothetical protein F4703DRAFT_1936953 [Phycomyces blakesleeanus]